jgi:hypothetical protein
VTVLLILAAGGLALLATVAAPLVRRHTRGLLQLDVEHRLAVFAGGVAILFGLVIAHFMS